MSRSCSTIAGRQAERQLVDHQQARLHEEGLAEGEHLLLAARHGAGLLLQRARAGSGRSRGPPRSRRVTYSSSSRYIHAAARRFSATVRLGKTARPPGMNTMPPAAFWCGGRWVMSWPSRKMAPFDASWMPADGAQQRRLAGAVRAEEGDELALLDVEVDVEQHLRAVVGDVDVAADDHLVAARARGPVGPPRRPSTPPGRRGCRARRRRPRCR